MNIPHPPDHDHVACSLCGRGFARPWHLIREGIPICPTCSRPLSCRGGYEPMIQIEAGEHQRLLQLYYAHFEHDVHPSDNSAVAVRQAIARCNRYYEGGTPCQ